MKLINKVNEQNEKLTQDFFEYIKEPMPLVEVCIYHNIYKGSYMNDRFQYFGNFAPCFYEIPRMHFILDCGFLQGMDREAIVLAMEIEDFLADERVPLFVHRQEIEDDINRQEPSYHIHMFPAAKEFTEAEADKFVKRINEVFHELGISPSPYYCVDESEYTVETFVTK